MSKHTPGPWFTKTGQGAHHRDIYIRFIRDSDISHTPAVAVTCSTGIRKFSEVEANARLMAAAPVLLEACKAVREELISHMQGAWPGTMSITARRVDGFLAAAIALAEAQEAHPAPTP